MMTTSTRAVPKCGVPSCISILYVIRIWLFKNVTSYLVSIHHFRRVNRRICECLFQIVEIFSKDTRVCLSETPCGANRLYRINNNALPMIICAGSLCSDSFSMLV